jgi:hypothetical protein
VRHYAAGALLPALHPLGCEPAAACKTASVVGQDEITCVTAITRALSPFFLCPRSVSHPRLRSSLSQSCSASRQIHRN